MRCGAFERLPEAALVLHIFTFLELRDVFKLRAVCKSWYDAVLSPYFIQLYKQPLDPWAVFRVRTEEPVDRYEDPGHTGYNYAYFDYEMKLKSHVEVWRPYAENQRKKCALPLGPLGSQFVGLCASNGLVCGRRMEDKQSLTLAVGNPITNTWNTLPPAPVDSRDIPRPAYLSIYMETDPTTSCYRVAVLYQRVNAEDDYSIYVVQYESEAGAWESGPVFSLGISSGLPLRGYAFFGEVDNIFPVYDPKSKSWSHIEIARPVCDEAREQGTEWENWLLTYVGAFMYKGKCLWASVLFKWSEGEESEELGFAIWEMDQEKASWILVSRILGKDLLGTKWGSHGDKDMKLHVVGDTVVISTFYKKGTYGECPPVAYNLATSKWYSSVSEEESGSNARPDCDIECSYVIIPSLTARP